MTEEGFEQVKKIMQIIGGQAIIVENGKPTFVLTDAAKYLGENTPGEAGSETELIDKINKDITIWKTKQKEKEMKQMEKELSHKERSTEIATPDTNL